jgi:hypothetical protein
MPSGWRPLATLLGWVVLLLSVGCEAREGLLAVRRERRSRQARAPDREATTRRRGARDETAQTAERTNAVTGARDLTTAGGVAAPVAHRDAP